MRKVIGESLKRRFKLGHLAMLVLALSAFVGDNRSNMVLQQTAQAGVKPRPNSSPQTSKDLSRSRLDLIGDVLGADPVNTSWVEEASIQEIRSRQEAIHNECRRHWTYIRDHATTLPAGLKRDEIALILLSTAPDDTLFADFFMKSWESRTSLNEGIVGKWLNAIADRQSLDLSVDMLKRLIGRPDSSSIIGLIDLQRLVAKQTIQHSTPEEAFSRLKLEGGLLPGLDMREAFIAALADELKPDQTAAFIDRHLADLASIQGTGGIAAFAATVGFRNPDGYSGKVEQWAVAMNAPRIATDFTSRWLDVDSQAATRWMGQLGPSPTLDGAIHALFLSGDILKSADRATLEQWAVKVSDPEIKAFVMRKLAH